MFLEKVGIGAVVVGEVGKTMAASKPTSIGYLGESIASKALPPLLKLAVSAFVAG